MKRSISLFAFFLFSIWCYSQVSVAGVSLKDEYNYVARVLESRYGTTIHKEHNQIKYKDITLGGLFFEWATFDFIYRPATQDRRLNYVSLSYHYKLSEFDKAKSQRDYIAEVYGKKYKDIEPVTLKSGIKAYRCAYDSLTEMYMILIVLDKGESNGGKTFYYLTVYYGPGYDTSTDEI